MSLLGSVVQSSGGGGGGDVSSHAALTQVHGISAFGATLVDDADAATARATLDVQSTAQTNSSAIKYAIALG